jgi:hypothetical protein
MLFAKDIVIRPPDTAVKSHRTAETKEVITEQRCGVGYFNIASTPERNLRNRLTYRKDWWRCRDLNPGHCGYEFEPDEPARWEYY